MPKTKKSGAGRPAEIAVGGAVRIGGPERTRGARETRPSTHPCLTRAETNY